MALASKAFFPHPGPNPICLLNDGEDIFKAVQDFSKKHGKHERKLKVESDDDIFVFRKEMDVVEYFKEEGVDHLVTNKDIKVSLEEEKLFKDKYVVIACFSVPLISGFPDAGVCHALKALSHKQQDSCVFILVIVVKRFTRDQDKAFKHFFSGFPDNFLAIPVDYREARESVCLYLSETDKPRYNGAIIDPTGKILLNSLAQLPDYGADLYPFSTKHLNECYKKDNLLKVRLNTFSYFKKVVSKFGNNDFLGIKNYKSPLSLAELLECRDPEGELLISRVQDGVLESAVPVSVLDHSIVGLYLCDDGYLMPTLKKVKEQCDFEAVRVGKPLFDIVIVPLALRDHPHIHLKRIMDALSLLDITTWWTLSPYNDKLTRTLWRLTGSQPKDRLIILPFADIYSGEIAADAVLTCLGALTGDNKPSGIPPSIYPFTREMLYQKRLSSLKEANLLLLLENFQVLKCKGGHLINLSGLRDKKVLLYINPYSKDSRKLFELDCEDRQMSHNYILKHHHSCEVVCVFPGVEPGDDFFSKLPAWLMVRPAEEAFEFLHKKLFLEQGGVKGRPCVIAFAKDGSVCSRKVFEGPAGHMDSLFKGKLEQEIFDEVTSEVESKIL